MRRICESRKKLGRGFVLLAPPLTHPTLSEHLVEDESHHQRLLADAQRLRGRIYVEDGAIRPSDLTAGRHIQAVDDLSWHLLTVDGGDRVTACIRYLVHRPGVSYPELAVSRSAAAHSPKLGPWVREAVQSELDYAARRGFSYVELGGWAISEELRCTTEAISTLVMVYALSQLLGGARALSTATTRHHSSSILRRVGGGPLIARGAEVPSYYDPHYKCEMELLSFDSTAPNPRYAGWIRDCRDALREVPIVCRQDAHACTSDLRLLQAAVTSYVTAARDLVALGS